MNDARWMAAALALAERGRGRTAPNPCVGCVIVNEGRVVGRGLTQPSGRPHAEAMAVAQAGESARGATAYVTLEPCSVRTSPRGPACADVLIQAGIARVVVAMQDPFHKIDGRGFALLREAGVVLTIGVGAEDAARSMAGFLTRQLQGRPFVTLKLATSLDGCIALASGESRWITGPEARAHAHVERSRHELILVGRGTWEADAPALDVRLAGLEGRSPVRVMLSSGAPAQAGVQGGEDDVRDAGLPPAREHGVVRITSPEDIATLPGDHLLVEGGAQTAASFLRAGIVDRLLLYRAPILIGGGKPALGDIGLTDLAAAHGRWRLVDARQLGVDRLEVYERP